MKTKLLYLLLLLPLTIFAQQRELLNGRVISDTIKVEYVSIKNLSSSASVVSDADGKFRINTRVGDTLRVSGISFSDAVVKVTGENFREGLIVIRLTGSITMLDEVVVNGLTGNLAYDSKHARIVETPAAKFDVHQINKDLYIKSVAGNGRGMDFLAIGRMVSGPPKRVTPPKQVFITDKAFAVAVRELYSDKYFVESLKIKKEDITLFLAYCDEGDSVRYLLNADNEFQLISYLSTKSEQYLKTKQ